MAVEPQRRLFHLAVEIQRTIPDVSLTGVGKVSLRQRQDAIALLHQSSVATNATACDSTSICGVVNLRCCIRSLTRSRTLHPSGHIEGQNLRLSTSLNGNAAVACLTDNGMFAVQATSNGAIIANLHTVGHRKWWRSNGNTLQLTQEEAGAWWLIIATHLPDHRITILVVMPQRRNTPFGRRSCRVDTDMVISCTQNNFFSPITEQVTLIAGCRLSIVIGNRAREGIDGGPRAILVDTALCRIIDIVDNLSCSVECLLTKVAIPIDSEVIINACCVKTTDCLSCYRAYSPLARRFSQSAWEAIGKITCHATAVIL